MHTHHAGDHIGIIRQCVFCPGSVLVHRFFRLVHAVSVGNFIAEAGADAEIFCRLTDLEKRVTNVTEAGVVVEDGGHALLDAV